MITVSEARQIIASQMLDFGTEEVPLQQATGRTLRESIFADRDFPPFDRVTMDGIAILHSAFEQGQNKFQVAGVVAAGDPKQTLGDPSKCLEIMTGAILPAGVDTVIPYEQIIIEDDYANIQAKVISKQNVHFKGLDKSSGDVILTPGIQLTPSEIGVCATVGKSVIRVSKLPRTMVLSSGDELVDIDQEPLPHQIRKSNIHRLIATLRTLQIMADHAHLRDNPDAIRDKLKKYLQEYDVILISGGVSKGKFDFLPQVLEEVGVKKLFHRISQRPGKPFWFGTNGEVKIFAFPGNPISSFMCMQCYFVPWLRQCIQEKAKPIPFASLAEDVSFKPELTYFLEVKLEFDPSGKLTAIPKRGHGSGDLANLVNADAFMELPDDRSEFSRGESYPVIIYRDIF